MKYIGGIFFVFCIIASIAAEENEKLHPAEMSHNSPPRDFQAIPSVAPEFAHHELTNKTTAKPTDKPTEKPTDKPTKKPTDKPTEKPTDKPTEKPTDKPTEKPTTSFTTPKTSTEPTTTSKPTTTTPKPSPSPSPPTPAIPEVGMWNVTQPGNNHTCIMAKMAIQLEIIYKIENETKTVVLNIPKNATANGFCGANQTTQYMAIMWNTTKVDNDSITFTFQKNSTKSDVTLEQINVIINGVFNITAPLKFSYNHSEFETPLARSYKCKKEQDLVLVGEKGINATLKVSHVQIQAFRDAKNDDNFDDAIDCLSSTPDIVPIAVGCALAALGVIFLLAYLYGRRRTQAGGYLSM